MTSVRKSWHPMTSEFFTSDNLNWLGSQIHIAYIISGDHRVYMQKLASLRVILQFLPQWLQFSVVDLWWPQMTSEVKITYPIWLSGVTWVSMPQLKKLLPKKPSFNFSKCYVILSMAMCTFQCNKSNSWSLFFLKIIYVLVQQNYFCISEECLIICI